MRPISLENGNLCAVDAFVPTDMTLDLVTLLAAVTAATISLAIPVLFVAWRARVHHGLTLWGLGLVLNSLSYPVFGLRAWGWTDLSIVLTNLLTSLTLVLHTQAIASFQRERVQTLSQWAVWSPMALNMVVVAVFLHDDLRRNILVAATQGLMAFMLLRQAWGPGLLERRLTGRWVLIGGAAMLFGALVCRVLFMVLASDWDPRYNVPSHVQAFTYFIVMAVVLINSMGFVLMQMERAIEQQRSLATHDALTGLYNRAALQDLLPMYGAQARRRGTPLAFLMLDIDRFKQVNDEHGHLAGDQVLKEVANRVRHGMRQSDFLARFGGEEFLAVLPATDGAGALVLAEKIRQSIEAEPVRFQEQGIAITISVGVSFGIPGESPKSLEELIAHSDQALYAAKSAGRNCVRLNSVPSQPV